MTKNEILLLHNFLLGFMTGVAFGVILLVVVYFATGNHIFI